MSSLPEVSYPHSLSRGCPFLTPCVQVLGYQIFCGGHLVQRVRSASRTKALLHGVALAEPTTIRIHSVMDGEVLSPPVEV